MESDSRVVLSGVVPILAHSDEYCYRMNGITFDVRKLAAMIPHFEAGSSEAEHVSLMLIAECAGSLPEMVGASAVETTCEVTYYGES